MAIKYNILELENLGVYQGSNGMGSETTERLGTQIRPTRRYLTLKKTQQ